MLSYVNEQGIELVSFSYENSFIYPVTPSTLKELERVSDSLQVPNAVAGSLENLNYSFQM